MPPVKHMTTTAHEPTHNPQLASSPSHAPQEARSRRYVLGLITALTLFTSVSLSGCGGLSAREKRSLGLREQRVEISDLGEGYEALKNTELDLFNPSPKSKVRLGRAPVHVGYHSYKLRTLDELLREGNRLYARYRFARHAVERFDQALTEALGEQGSRMNTGEMGATLALTREEHPERLKRLALTYQGTRLGVESAQSLVTEARALIASILKDKGQAGLKHLKSSPKSAALAPDAMRDLKVLKGRLERVQKGTPKLAARLGELKVALAALSLLL